jgi:tripartite-type tricarboxylate transporter receptor subunit TctC
VEIKAMQTAFSRLCPALNWIVFCLALVAYGGVQAQQNWPSRPIRILVPYPPGGSTDILSRLLDVQFTTDNLPQLLPQIRVGKLQPLAVTSPQRWFQLPEVPTVSEAGFPNMTTTAWFGLVAQSKTQAGVIVRMNRELVAILQKPDFIARLREYSFGALPGTPEDMSAAARKERESWKKVVEVSGAKAE